jgi:hypothetical protein
MLNGLIIVLTMTTCHRPDLFVKTVKSIKENVTDIDLVDKWIIIDDNTPKEFHQQMKEVVPHNTQWIWKTSGQKGHAKSMNMLKKEIPNNTRFIFHWEDDWKVIVPSNYVERLVGALNENTLLGQVLINENYKETKKEESKITQDNVVIHQWDPNKKEYGTFYWPHYSLRPGMMLRSVWDNVGDYNETHSHFEREYADRYFHTHGYMTGFLPGVNSIHLGKCTWEKEKNVPSAYTLNGLTRF